MESSRSRNGVGAGRAGAIVAIVAGLVVLPPAIAGGEDPSAGAPPPDADGIVGNEEATTEEPAVDADGGPGPGTHAAPVAAPEDADPDALDGDGVGASGAAPDKRRAPCPNADAGAQTLTNAEIAKSILCLVNKERKQRNRARVARNGDLDKAARKHSVLMERDNCFEHKCPGEPRLAKRIVRSGYTDGAERWRFAENLGCAQTTQDMIDGWLDSDFNRTNLLNRRYEDIGVGVVHGSPLAAEPNCPDSNVTATYTLVFAFRRG